MKKSAWIFILILATVAGFITLSSCKRSNVDDPEVIGPAGFRISLVGTADPSTLYVPDTTPAVYSVIKVRVLKNDATPVTGHDVVFQHGGYGYFEGFKASAVKTTNAAGEAQITYFLPPGTAVKAEQVTTLTATLVDAGRIDSSILTEVVDYIPIRVIPYVSSGLILGGTITTPAGNGIENIVVTFAGSEGNKSGFSLTQSDGSFEFLVAGGWYGTISPSADGYSFTPSNYEFFNTSPIYNDYLSLDFVGSFDGGNNLAADVTQWMVEVEGGTQSVNVYNATGDSPISYSIVTNTDWLHVSKTNGVTPGNFVMTAEENHTGSDRTGLISIAATDTAASNVTINVTQSGNETHSDAKLEVDRETLNFDANGGTKPVNVYNSKSSDNIEFVVTNNIEEWLTVSDSIGVTDMTMAFICSPNNEGPERSGVVILTVTSTGVSNSEVRITVNQDPGASIKVEPDVINARQSGDESYTIMVSNSGTDDYELTWTAENDDTWIAISPTSGRVGNSFVITVQTANNSQNERVGVVFITADNGAKASVTVKQAGTNGSPSPKK
jgi:hypothetical protein